MRVEFLRCIVLWLLLLYGTPLWGQLRVATYNTATSGENGSPSEPRSQMRRVLEGIGDQMVSGIARPLDVLLLQEQHSLETSTQAIVELLNDLYGEGIYARGLEVGRTNGGGRGAIVYNTQTVELMEELAFGTVNGSVAARETMRYTLRPVGYDEDANFYAYVNHYKSGATESDQIRRDLEAREVRANANRLDSAAHILFAGDFNIQNCNERMMQTLTADGSSQAIDPVNPFGSNCDWHNNAALKRWHTQSPSDGTDGSLVGGGMDDRFDFQLVTDDLLDGEGLSMVPNSYRTFGNNGSHPLNGAVNDLQNDAAPRSVLNALARTSDHLPVVVDYQIPARMDVDVAVLPERVIRGSLLTLDAVVYNSAPVNARLGADELDYRLTVTVGDFEQPLTAAGAVLATDQAPVSIALPTNEVGNFVYRADIESDSEGVVDGDRLLQSGFYTVIEAAEPSLRSEWLGENDLVDLQVLPISETPLSLEFDLQNLASMGLAADLHFDGWSLSGEAVAMLTTNLDEQSLLLGNTIGPGESLPFVVTVDTTSPGPISATLMLNLSEDDTLIGASTSSLEVGFSGHIGIPGDANLDGQVTFTDFLLVSRNFDRTDASWSDGDFNGDGVVAFPDFLTLSRNFGQQTSVVAVPESSALSLWWIAVCILVSRLRRSSCLRLRPWLTVMIEPSPEPRHL